MDQLMPILLDTYEGLLTDTQVRMLRMRFDDDLSLQEIGELCGISRQAAHDAIAKGEQKLRSLEETLHVAEKERRLKALAEEMTRAGISGFAERLIEITEDH